MNKDTYNSDVYECATYLLDHVDIKPKVGIICGTGLGFLARDVQNPIEVPYKSIPNFPVSTTKGHFGNLVFGYISGIPVMCLQGRFHFFEGYSPEECAMPIRIMKMMGVSNVIVSNSAGALNPTYKVGNIMIIKDHINMLGMAGFNPLRGPNTDALGPRFPNMNNAYNPQFIKYAKEIATEEKWIDDIYEGVYGCVAGPNFETVAETKMLKILGMDAVGMSTVHEVLTAKHCGMNVFAFSIITNVCNSGYNNKECADHEEILNVAETKKHILKKLIIKVVQRMNTFQ